MYSPYLINKDNIENLLDKAKSADPDAIQEVIDRGLDYYGNPIGVTMSEYIWHRLTKH